MNIEQDDNGSGKSAELKNDFNEEDWFKHLLRNYNSQEAIVSRLEQITESMDETNFTKNVKFDMYDCKMGELVDENMTNYSCFQSAGNSHNSYLFVKERTKNMGKYIETSDVEEDEEDNTDPSKTLDDESPILKSDIESGVSHNEGNDNVKEPVSGHGEE